MRKTSKAAEVSKRYTNHIDSNIEMLERMLKTLKAEKKATKDPNWSDVATQGHYRENIQEMCDCMHDEGEYAPENIVSSSDRHNYTPPTYDRSGRSVK